MSNFVLCIFITILLAGCTSTSDMLHSMYNIPSAGSSTFDGSKHIRVTNIYCSPIVFELYQESRQHKNEMAVLRAGTASITNIADGEALHLKIGDQVFSYPAVSSLTDHDTIYFTSGISRPFSYKTFLVPVSVVRQAAASNSLYARLYLLNQSYLDGKCSPVTLFEALEASAKYAGLTVTQENVDHANEVSGIFGFREFVKMMDATLW